ncbi:DUF2316 family protein [Enterococcus sp. DIV0800]|uniref:DUF2316 family protein n=1 Tax=unclassified Enterococcus TaxID=2608891 RepID=UPI003D2FB050
MSLNQQQTINTKNEFQENFERSGLSLEQIAADLNTTPAVIADTLALNVSRIEDPWVLKNYLEDALQQQGIASVPFTALVGDYHRHWFLNSRRIDKKKIG